MEDFENQVETDETPDEISEETEEKETADAGKKKKSVWGKVAVAVISSVCSILAVVLIAAAAFLYYEQKVLIPQYKKEIKSLGLSEEIDADKVKLTDILKSGVDIKKLIADKDSLSVDDIKKLAVGMGYSEKEINSLIEKYGNSQETQVSPEEPKTENKVVKKRAVSPNARQIANEISQSEPNIALTEEILSSDIFEKVKSRAEAEDTSLDITNEFDGSGTKSNPFLIKTADDLIKLSDFVNSGHYVKSKYFSLQNDIDFGGNELTPIGTFDHPFCATFSGNGHTVSNVKIGYIKETDYTFSYSGFFGVCFNAAIKDFELKNANLNYAANGTPFSYVGVLIGNSVVTDSLRITNCKISADINNATFDSGCIGGICGSISTGSSSNTVFLENTQIDLTVGKVKSSSAYFGTCVGNFEFWGNLIKCNNVCATASIENIDVGNGIICGLGNVLALTDNSYFYTYNSYFNTNIASGSCSGIFACADIEIANGIGQPKIIFENVFGYATDAKSLIGQTNVSSAAINNCNLTSKLPSNCGFDTNIWDISNPSNPRLK